MSADERRIPRIAKGKRPQYFSDPAVDKLLNMVVALAGELSVTRDRLDALERLLAAGGGLDRDALDRYEPDEAAAAERARSRAAYLERVLRPARQELDELVRRRAEASTDELLDEFSR